MLFHKEFSFLSNFYNAQIRVDLNGMPYVFQCSEAFFQAMKSTNKNTWIDFQSYNGGKSKRMGKRVRLRENWEQVKEMTMEKIVRMKFKQHPELTTKLINVTGEIIEHNTWCDNEWGACLCYDCKDKQKNNKLGKILMKVRNGFIDDIIAQ